jgi:hypothetical protein
MGYIRIELLRYSMVSTRFDPYLQVKRPLKSFDTSGLAICFWALRIFLAEENVIRVEIIQSLYLFDNTAGFCLGLRHGQLLNCYLDGKFEVGGLARAE